MIGAVLIIALVLLFALFFVPGAGTPRVRLADPGPGPGTEGGPADHLAMGVEITTENVQAVIATLQRAATYTREIRQTHYWNDGQSSGERTAEIWVTPRALRVDWDDNESMVITADTYHLWFEGGPIITRPVTEGLGESLAQILDQFQGIPSYETVLALDTDQIISAGYTERVLDGELRPVIYVAAPTGALGYVDFFYICLTTGLLIEVTTFDGEIPIYRLETLRLTIGPPDAEAFLLPDGTNPLD